jgi:hypothetical protein
MKNIIIVTVVSCIVMMACTKQTPTTVVDDPIDTTNTGSAGGILRYQASFKNGPYGNVSGSVAIHEINGKWELRLLNFRTSNGPDLKVYLSKEIQPLNFIRLGDLKSTSGNQAYPINGKPDIMQYKYTLIHCEQYNHLFGSAELMLP